MGWFAPSFMMVSIPSLDATPSYRQKTASFIMGISKRFEIKPGESLTSRGICCKDRLLRAYAVQIFKDLFLHILFFYHGFDYEISVHAVFKAFGDADFRKDPVFLPALKLPFTHSFLQSIFYFLKTCSHIFFAHIFQHYHEAALGCHLGYAAAHCPCADHTNLF